MSKNQLKIFFYSVEGVGHTNASIGLAQALAKRGHLIYFITSSLFSGSFEKFGFKELRFNTKEEPDQSNVHPLEKMKYSLLVLKESELSSKSPLEKLDSLSIENSNKNIFFKMVYDQMIEMHPQLVDAIEKYQPNLFILDTFLVFPCILFGNIPWILQNSCNPVFLFNSKELPPPMSGYPSNDRTGWEEFRKKFNQTVVTAILNMQNDLNEKFGYKSLNINVDNMELNISPYLNVYGYPEELDYKDVAEISDKYARLDAFCRESDESFELPEKFRKKLQPNDKLVYVSMGSMGSIDVDLMKRIIKPLSTLPYKFIVSKGPFAEEYELGDNMWGESYLPQIKILPLVDMVITHGGNNTITETMAFGKPMLVMPLFGDQFDNAQRVFEKGYGYRVEPYRFEDSELIEKVEKILNDNEMIKRGQKAAERIRNSNSKEKVCKKIEQVAEQFFR